LSGEERQCLFLWVSLLKKRTTFEKEKTEVRLKHLDVREILLNKKQAIAKKLDAKSQKLLADAKYLYVTVEARANATIKQEDLIARTLVVSEWWMSRSRTCGTRTK
jgi:hypothetical protein